ncbi:ABC transporter permease subunit [Asticcacaulis sp. ZE23SCel15]|uniref:amino acid ABC transporter permease n=1 Tax=Asticcacaulis sp. ZE23SCel15 TaxID=3059027 RepID=UPI00265E9024|nr:ABC transporter permease subunit [Asticcacaulis sp. ZE23SCel15]WKL56076.1 ABC transporter permease subunit [Asticcacaulis sp. ZE23SCel15]
MVWWRDQKFRAIAFQLLAASAFIGLILWLTGNTAANLAKRGLTVGFDFLGRAARFPISESVLSYSPTDHFWWAYTVGLGNTLFITVIVAITATVLGLMLAILRREDNPLAQGAGTTYVEFFRNTPLVVQLLFWYALVTVGLPSIDAPLNPLPGVYLTERGLYLPALSLNGLDMPVRAKFNFEGGLNLSPEFVAMYLGLSLYAAAFIGEIIRGGLEAVAKGQTEAALALGLAPKQALNLVLIPQALRIIIPPMTSQYINILKNSTLALVVGYPDISFVTATTINQTGQALEGIFILMLVFFTISIATSVAMNLYNARVALKVR